MARTKALKRIAQDWLKGSCIRNATFERECGKGLEYVKVVNGKVTDDKVINLAREAQDVTQPAQLNNGLQLQGYVMVDRLPVPFYGSEKAWNVLKAMD